MLYTLPLLAPLALAAAALVAFLNPGMRPRLAVAVAELAALAALAVTTASIVLLLRTGPRTSPVLGAGPISFAAQLDTVSVAMMALVSFVGWVVLRYSRTYLDGEANQGRFTGWMCLTLASVLVLVLAGTLAQLVTAWIATSMFLHQLLVFYPGRIAAQRAARKKFLTARLGDIALLVAAVLLAAASGTGHIATILSAARAGHGGSLAATAAGFLAVAAILKSAQFPLHGWLTEVVETPTPVSALLHAGVVNAGGFLLIRFADVMLLAPGVLAALVLIGGFTALFGGLVMLTQPAVKTSLAWSTVAQMGFMVFQCGLALFPLALLHIVAHSLYKAHSFLSCAGAVERVTAIRRPGPIAVPKAAAVARAFLVALVIFILTGMAFGFSHKSPQAIALGAILVFGVAYLLAQGLADAAPRALTWRTASYSALATVAHFTLQTVAVWLTRDVLPVTPSPGNLEWALIVLAVISFATVAVAQTLFPLWAHHPAAQGLRVHLSNGLYAYAALDRLLGTWTLRKAGS